MCKVRGIGIDLCDVGRMQALLNTGHSLRRLFTPEEEAYSRGKGRMAAQSMAGIYAAKEAVLKALGTGLTIPLTDVEIVHTELGQPVCVLRGKAAPLGGQMLVSITHEGNMAAGMAVWQE